MEHKEYKELKRKLRHTVSDGRMTNLKFTVSVESTLRTQGMEFKLETEKVSDHIDEICENLEVEINFYKELKRKLYQPPK